MNHRGKANSNRENNQFMAHAQYKQLSRFLISLLIHSEGRALVGNFNPRVPLIKGLEILRVPGNFFPVIW